MAFFDIDRFSAGNILLSVSLSGKVPTGKEYGVMQFPKTMRDGVDFRRGPFRNGEGVNYRGTQAQQKALDTLLDDYAHYWAEYGQNWIRKRIGVGSKWGVTNEAADNVKIKNEGGYWVLYEDTDADSWFYPGSKIYSANNAIRHGFRGARVNYAKRSRRNRIPKTKDKGKRLARFIRRKKKTQIAPNSPWGHILAWGLNKGVIKASSDVSQEASAYLIWRKIASNGWKSKPYNYAQKLSSSINRSIKRDVVKATDALGGSTAMGYMNYLVEKVNKKTGATTSKGWSVTLGGY